jgi:hypothetical protein
MPSTPTKDKAAEKTEAEAEAPKEPVARNFTGTIEVYAFSDSDSELVTTDSFEAALKEQVILPVALDIGGIKLSVSGAKITDSSESDKGSKHEAGFGREAPEDDGSA